MLCLHKLCSKALYYIQMWLWLSYHLHLHPDSNLIYTCARSRSTAVHVYVVVYLAMNRETFMVSTFYLACHAFDCEEQQIAMRDDTDHANSVVAHTNRKNQTKKKNKHCCRVSIGRPHTTARRGPRALEAAKADVRARQSWALFSLCNTRVARCDSLVTLLFAKVSFWFWWELNPQVRLTWSDNRPKPTISHHSESNNEKLFV